MKTIIKLLIFQAICNLNLHAQDPLYIKDTNLPCVERKFWVYVHVVADSLGTVNITEAQIRAQLESANLAFAPICLSFDFCKIDTVVDYSFLRIDDQDEVELMVTRFHKKRRINIYYTNSVLSNQINSFSYFDGINKVDRAVIMIPMSGIGLIHELGHTFGLYHIFETKYGAEKADGSNCKVSGDLICDTPASPNISPDEDCTFTSKQKDENGDFYRTEVGNYMSHFFCAHCFFTTEQYEKMANNYLNSPIKLW